MSTQTPCHNILQTRPFDRISGCTSVPSGGSSTAARREYRSYPTLNPSLGEGLHGKPDSLPTHRQRNPAGKTGYFGTLQTRPFDRISGCTPVPSGGSYTAARREYRSYPTLNSSLGEGLRRKPDSLPTHRRGILPERPDTSERCKPVRSIGFPAAYPFRPAVATRRHAVITDHTPP